jgi:uncharacterized protein (TIGR01777 family)
MRIVVAGGSGLIGSALLPVLRAAGHDVLQLVRGPARDDQARWDPPAGRIDAGALDGADAVVNLCGVGVADRRWSQARKQLLRDSRVEPTEVLAEAVARHGVGTLVNASGVDYYGDTGDREVDESTPNGTGFLAELCRVWEVATESAAAAGARVVRLRIAPVLATDGGIMAVLRPTYRLLLGARLGSGRQYFPWIHLDDVLTAVLAAVQRPSLSGAVNLVAPQQVTFAEFSRALAASMRRPAPWVVPSFAIRAVAGELSGVVLDSHRVRPAALLADGFEFRHPRLDGALAALGRP